MKTIITAKYLKEPLLHELAQGRTSGLTDIDVRTLSSFDAVIRPNRNLLLLQLAHRLQAEQEKYEIYGQMFAFPAFISEILSFAGECILYGITPDSLPAANVQQKDLREILAEAMAMDLPEKETVQQEDAFLDKVVHTENIELHDYFETSPYQYRLLEKLKEKIPFVPREKTAPKTFLRSALNARQELEAIAQDIIRQGVPCNVILTSMSFLPVLKMVFDRYQIPYSYTSSAAVLRIPLIYQALVALGLNKDTESFLAALGMDAFPYHCDDALQIYLEQTLTDFSPANIAPHLAGTVHEKEADKYQQCYEQAAEYMERISQWLDPLLEAEGKDILIEAYRILKASPYLSGREELNAGLRIRAAVSEALAEIFSDEDVRFLVNALSRQSSAEMRYDTDFCMVTDIRRPVPAKTNAYVVHCDGASYPGFRPVKGLFDEDYVSGIPLYPSAAERYDMYMSQLQWIASSAHENLYYSYPVNDYQGREIQLAFEIESLFPKNSAIKWRLDRLAPHDEKEHHLDPALAEKLFYKKGYIRGSISTIENWFRCPYAYFLKSGLKLYENRGAAMDDATFGNIQHDLMQRIVEKDPKHYGNTTREGCRNIIHKQMEALRQMYPYQAEALYLSEERMLDSLERSLLVLKDMEAHTTYRAAAMEKHFDEFCIGDVCLNGIIDRFDSAAGNTRVIDYKSSGKKLEPAKVQYGLQLQLLTYLIITEELYHSKPAGAYYFSLKDVLIDFAAAGTSGRGKNQTVETNVESEETAKEAIIRNRRLSGWTYIDSLSDMDDDKRHIPNSKARDYGEDKQIILDNYARFAEEIKAGNIALDPTEGACEFCPYRAICRFAGTAKKIPGAAKEEEDAV
ncbi:MAG: PD-(D/E)XK nuclease family protein [Solobacterium sp.]|nr:PD-(D/E)XK nuclease family protein [Solobacterium sp.]